MALVEQTGIAGTEQGGTVAMVEQVQEQVHEALKREYTSPAKVYQNYIGTSVKFGWYKVTQVKLSVVSGTGQTGGTQVNRRRGEPVDQISK